MHAVEISNFRHDRTKTNLTESNQILYRIDSEPNQNSNRTRIRSGFNSDTNSSLGSNLASSSGSILVRIRFG